MDILYFGLKSNTVFSHSCFSSFAHWELFDGSCVPLPCPTCVCVVCVCECVCAVSISLLSGATRHSVPIPSSISPMVARMKNSSQAVFHTRAPELRVKKPLLGFALGEEEARPPCTRAGGGATTWLRLDEVPRAGRVYYAVTPRPPPS